MERRHVSERSEDELRASNTMSRTGRLAWVNYADPQRERKSKENRAVVRSVAKLSTLPSRTLLPGSPPVPLSAAATEVSSAASSENGSDGISITVSRNRSHRLPSQGSVNPFIWFGNSDPFDSLPIRTNSHSFFLLNRYCERPHLRPTCPSICAKTQELRRQYLLPTLIRSKGTLHVALMHVERGWRLSDENQHNEFQTYQQSGAILELQKALQDRELLVPIELFLMIGKLATAAIHAGDHFAIEAHYNGMAQLFLHHWEDLAGHPLFVLGAFAFWSAISVRNMCCVDKAEIRQTQTSSRSTVADENSLVSPSIASAFARLRLCGLISQATLDVMPKVVRLSQLIDLARKKKLTIATARELLQLKWHCSACFQRLAATAAEEETFPFERALWPTLQLVLTLCINPSMQMVPDYYCPSIKEHLSDMDLTSVLETCPEALLWMLLVVGSCCQQIHLRFFSMTLRLLASDLNMSRFENALLYARQFIWTSQLDKGASRFWHNTIRDPRSNSEQPEK